MNFWSEIVGQSAAVDVLERAAAEGGQPAHAWLITGPPGSGRSNLAYRFAAALMARTVEERESTFAKVRARSHPDLGVLTTQATVITIDAGREIVTTAHYAPSEGRYRVIVVEDADRMPERTSNVLLKAIEEPPEGTIWVLCAPSEADLLPTIRSRSRSLRLVTPSVAEVAQLLVERDGVDAALAERAARLAQCHIGMARRLASSPEALDRRERSIKNALGAQTIGDAMAVATSLVAIAQADADALTEQLDSKEREEAMRSLGLNPGAAIPPKLRSQIKALEEDQERRRKRSLRDGVDRILTDLLSLYRDVLLTTLGAIGEGSPTELVNAESKAAIHDLAERWSPEQALAVVTAAEEARTRLGRAITPALVLEALFARIVMADNKMLAS